MLKNYLKIAWRNLVKNKTFSIINILGLATGLCCFLLIALYVMDELSYDRFWNYFLYARWVIVFGSFRI